MRERRFTIGRGSGCDIVLADATVSRLHATLTLLDGGRLLLTDCHSANGTKVFLKGDPVKITHELVLPGDAVQFGDIVWEVNDMLKALWLKNPTFDPSSYSHPVELLREGYDPTQLKGVLAVCKTCFYLKPKGETCPNCSTPEANTVNDG